MVLERLLIRGGHVVTLDAELGEFPDGDVLIEGEKIAEIGHHLDAGNCEVVDATGKIVIPGFVDTHRHTWQTPTRGLGADFMVQEYRSCVKGFIGPNVRPEDVYAGTLAGALEALDSGITTLVDWAHIMNSPEHADASIDALEAAGLRAVFAFGTPSDKNTDAWYKDSALPHPHDVRRIRNDRLSSDTGLITLALAVRPPHIVQHDVMVHDWQLARELGIRLTSDAGIGGGTWSGIKWGPGGHQPLHDLQRAGLLGPDTTYVHCNNLPDEDLKLIADSGGSISTSPDAEMHVGHCFSVMGRAVAHGIRPALSIDIVCQVAGDMFGAMRTVLASERGLVGARCYADGVGPGPWEITTKDVLEFATIAGARASGLGDRVGTLVPGKQADLLLIDAHALNLLPMNNAIGLVVLQAHPGNVDSVYVAGRAVKRDGRLVHVDLRRVRELVNASRDHLFAAGGITPGWGYRPPELADQWRW